MSHHCTPIRTLPAKPDLKQLKKQAKDLLKAFHAGESAAIAEVRAHYHGLTPGDVSTSEPFQLSEAQLVLARAYGFESWAKLKAFVDGVTVSRFVAAVQAGDLEGVRAMIRQRPELVHMDTAGNNEQRGLHYAVLRRDLAMVRLLMQAGADARQGVYPHREATTALVLAGDRGYQDIVAVIEEEEQHRREGLSCPNSKVSPAQDQINEAIRHGDNATAIRLLGSDHSLIRACDRDGGTPLHVAAQVGNHEMVSWLLARRASARKRDARGLTPLERAALGVDPRNGRAKHFSAVASLLLEHGAEVTMSASVALADLERIRELASNDPGLLRGEIHWWKGGLLTLAVKHGHLEVVRLLLDLGADVDERTTLHELEEPTLSWGAPLWYAALAGRRDIAELLLDRGADPNANLYASGWPLSRAYERGDEAMKRLLVERGAKPKPHLVAQAHDVAEARRMLESDASEEVAEELCWSAAESGCPAIVELALPHLRWPPTDPRWHWILIQPIRGVGDHLGALPAATADNCLRCQALLLLHGIDVNVSRRGETVLHFIAARQGVENDSDRARFAAMLLDAGARLDLRDDLLKSTPLGWACRWGRKELVDLLIARGAPVNEPDAESWATPLAWARKMGHTAIERHLHDQGATA
ncbi:MAG TPA: ankyrin repeat domain-containing protein [Terriglobia bacterium]|nr:ankyrin repeat domain-containing protein [Terriglobia bacterium]